MARVADQRRVARAAVRWETIPARKVARHEGTVDRILDGTIDGITIDGVLSKREVGRALPRLLERRRSGTPEPFGVMLGAPLNQVGDTSTDRSPHIAEAERWRPVYREAFGFDPHDRIASVLAPMASGRAVVPPSEEGRAYNPGNVRIYDPGRGGLRAHVGNEFKGYVGDGAMSHLLETTHVHDHLSWFVVLQQPERGGALSVYDLLHRDHPEHDTAWDGAMRDDRWFDDQPCLRHDLRAGQMVLFCGGRRWHRVDPVEGGRPRVTYGGFAAPAVAGHELHVWC